MTTPSIEAGQGIPQLKSPRPHRWLLTVRRGVRAGFQVPARFFAWVSAWINGMSKATLVFAGLAPLSIVLLGLVTLIGMDAHFGYETLRSITQTEETLGKKILELSASAAKSALSDDISDDVIARNREIQAQIKDLKILLNVRLGHLDYWLCYLHFKFIPLSSLEGLNACNNLRNTPEVVKLITSNDPYTVVQKELLLELTRNILHLYNFYFLPMIYGGLGGLLFVMTRYWQDPNYPLSFGHSTIRFILGILSGLLIGLFLRQDQATSTAIPPLAWSLVAGYSVEMLIQAMDRFIGTKPPPGGRRNPDRTPRGARARAPARRPGAAT